MGDCGGVIAVINAVVDSGEYLGFVVRDGAIEPSLGIHKVF